GIGEHVAVRGMARGVVALGAGLVGDRVDGVASSASGLGHARVLGGGDVAADGSDRGREGLPAALARLFGARADSVKGGIAGAGLEIGVSGGDQLESVLGQAPPVGLLVLEGDRAQQAAVVTGLDHGPLLVVGPGGGIGVGLMGVAVEDRVDLGGGL